MNSVSFTFNNAANIAFQAGKHCLSYPLQTISALFVLTMPHVEAIFNARENEICLATLTSISFISRREEFPQKKAINEIFEDFLYAHCLNEETYKKHYCAAFVANGFLVAHNQSKHLVLAIDELCNESDLAIEAALWKSAFFVQKSELSQLDILIEMEEKCFPGTAKKREEFRKPRLEKFSVQKKERLAHKRLA